MQEGRHRKTSLEKYSPLNLFVRFAFERMLETEHKHYILTPLLWPSRCVLFSWCWGPLHRVWPSLPHLVSPVWKSAGNSFGGFPSAPSVGCGLPYYIWSLLSGSLLGTASGVFRVPPLSAVDFPTTSGLSRSLPATDSAPQTQLS